MVESIIKSYIPKDLEEALNIINKEETIVIAGGSDLMVRRKRPSGLLPNFDKTSVFITRLKELKKIYKEGNFLMIGGGCTFTEISESNLVPDYFKDVIGDIASPAIRNIATIAGNICNASPAADILPLLYALEVKLVVKSISEEKIIPIEKFIVSPGRTVLNKNEIVKEIQIPLSDFNKFYFKKVGTRKATAISKLSFVAFGKVNDDIIEDVRIAFGAVAPTIVKSKDIENKIINKNIVDIKSIKDDILNDYSILISPIDDQRSNKEYRKQVSLNLLSDFLDKI